ncbi:aminopeptidase [Balneola sp. MJW-20]|uniref:aminopeptidase n=1 Tax=Gracilimonas aurantiaca TaxID=3234185 RepID=UPI00346610A6
MISQHDQKLAKLILEHSTELKKGENVMVQLIGLNGIDLMRALIGQIREAGAHPFVKIEDTEVQRMLIENGDEGFWKNQAKVDQLPLMKQMDVFIGIRASQNIYETSMASKEANKAYSEHFLRPVHFDERVNNTKWCIMRYPSPAFAMNAKLPTDKFTEFYYKACLVDYPQLAEAMKPLEKRLRATDEIHLKGEGTDIRFSVKGQNWIPCYGRHNIPDGELFSSPVLDSVNGHITYAPSVYQGKPFEFVKLIVEDGVVVDFDSSNNDALKDILDTDEGARRFGEFSFGLNPVIESPMYDILFDEKIYGSNHLTLGKDYEVAPNGNHSNIHWDLVCIGADVYLDGELIRKGRKFVADDLKGLNPENLV